MRIVGVLLGALLCVACGGESQEDKPAVDTAGYLEVMRTHYSGADDKTLLDSGHATCEALRSGKTRDDLIFEKMDRGLNGSNAVTLVTVPAHYLCPEFKDK